MNQTSLSRYERGRTGSNKETSQSEKDSTGERKADSTEERAGLNPDEEAVMDYIVRKRHVAKEELQHQSGLPETQLDGILESLENRGLIEVSSGYTVVQIQPQNEIVGGNNGVSQ